MYKKWIIGDKVIDGFANAGVVAIVWSNGETSVTEHTATHPNPWLSHSNHKLPACPKCGEAEPVLYCEKCGHTFPIEDG